MHILYIGILILLLIFLIPIPIKFKVKYSKKELRFILYNIDITNKMNYIKNKTKLDIKYKEDRIPIFSNTLKVSLNSLKAIKFKPSLKIKINIEYGLDDAAQTAFAFGLLSTFVSILLKASSSFIHIKDEKVNIKPEFNKLILILEIDSIIFINLAKVIYISAIIYRNLRNKEKINLANT